MEIQLSLIEEHSGWQQHPVINLDLCKKIIQNTLSFFPAGLLKQLELSILLTDNTRMQALNKQFLNKDYPTNVLAFPDQTLDRKQILLHGITEAQTYLGDIAIGYDIVKQEAQLNNLSIENHFIHLIIHAILHLLGFDHDTDSKTTEMQNIEISLLQSFDIASPYNQ